MTLPPEPPPPWEDTPADEVDKEGPTLSGSEPEPLPPRPDVDRIVVEHYPEHEEPEQS